VRIPLAPQLQQITALMNENPLQTYTRHAAAESVQLQSPCSCNVHAGAATSRAVVELPSCIRAVILTLVPVLLLSTCVQPFMLSARQCLVRLMHNEMLQQRVVVAD